MNRVIYKYVLALVAKQTISMKMDACILDVQFQRATLCIWALVRPDYPSVNRTFVVAETGEHLDSDRRTVYLGTSQQNDRLVYHLFEEI